MTRHETEIMADEKVPTIEIIREFDATPEQVFRAHVDPELYAQWVGPRSVTTRVTRWEARTGGAWAFANDRDGEEIASFYGSFHEVRPHERIVWTFTYEGEPDGVALETLTFEEFEGGRTRLRVLSVVQDFETRDGMLSSGMDVGVNEGFDKLDELLAKGPEMTLAPMSPAQQHAYDAARFTELVESASAGHWAQPSPVAEWTALTRRSTSSTPPTSGCTPGTSPRRSAASPTWARSAATPRWRPWSRWSRCCATAGSSVPLCPSPTGPPRRIS